MTNRTSSKKVVKNMTKANIPKTNYSVVKHFEPSSAFSNYRTNLKAEIPIVNIDSRPELKVTTKRTPSCARKKTIVKISTPCNESVPSVITNRIFNHISRVDREETEAKPVLRNFRSSSSSSLESKTEKFTNTSKLRFSTTSNESARLGHQKNARSARELSSFKKDSCLKSKTDPSLLKQQLNLKSLKQEILGNGKCILDTESPRVVNMRTPNHRIKNNMLEKKIFITELRSEIAEFKRFNRFQVYNLFDDKAESKSQNSGRSVQRNSQSVERSVEPIQDVKEKLKQEDNFPRDIEPSSREYSTTTLEESGIERKSSNDVSVRTVLAESC